ncbi:hypothetical protein KY363_02000 [Candidatus Woesearchaeota archaeon]|nr:hypothetical protein [Candidatus Woesearchaeota archaeon]
MTKQITIKLNEEQFQPLLDTLQKFAGDALGETNSDFVAKTLFFCYYFITKKHPEFQNKTDYELLAEMKHIDKAEVMLEFLNEYSRFKKEGLDIYKRK